MSTQENRAYAELVLALELAANSNRAINGDTVPQYQRTTLLSIADALRSRARSLHRLDEAACNHGLTPAQERRVERLERQAQEMAQGFGLTAYHQGDPRGYALYLRGATLRGRSNSWGGAEHGWGIG